MKHSSCPLLRLLYTIQTRTLFRIGVGSNFILGGGQLVGTAPLGGQGACPLGKFCNFRHSEIVSRAILQELDDML